jgi:hypothetical protein
MLYAINSHHAFLDPLVVSFTRHASFEQGQSLSLMGKQWRNVASRQEHLVTAWLHDTRPASIEENKPSITRRGAARYASSGAIKTL